MLEKLHEQMKKALTMHSQWLCRFFFLIISFTCIYTVGEILNGFIS